MNISKLEQKLSLLEDSIIIGVSSVGEDSVVGPIIASAVALNYNDIPVLNSSLDKDIIYSYLTKQIPFYNICEISSDRLNIISNSKTSVHLARSKAVEGLYWKLFKSKMIPTHLLSDSLEFKEAHEEGESSTIIDIPYTLYALTKIRENSILTIPKGNNNTLCLACAYFLSMYTYYNKLVEINKIYPEYNLLKNFGKLDEIHKESIKNLGITEYHRLYMRKLSKAKKRFTYKKFNKVNDLQLKTDAQFSCIKVFNSLNNG